MKSDISIGCGRRWWASVCVVAGCAVGAVGAPVMARQQPATEPTPRPASEPVRQPGGHPSGHPSGQPSGAPQEDVLRGPKVEDGPARPTLVKRDFGDALVRLDERPEAAAIELLGLSDQERAACDAVLKERAAKVSAFTFDHYEQFQKIVTAQKGGSGEEARPLIRQLAGEARDLLDPPLKERIAGVIGAEKRAEFLRLVGEYDDALMREGPVGSRGGDPEDSPQRRQEHRDEQGAGEQKQGESGNEMKQSPPPREGRAGGPMAGMRVEVRLLLHEMGGSFKSFVEDRREHIDALMRAVEATPEQENRIRGMIREAAAESKFKPTAEKRAEIFKRIMDELTPEQRVKARGMVREK